MARLLAPERELPAALRAPVDARLGPSDSVWAVVAGEGEAFLVATDRELLHVVAGRVLASWPLADLDDIRPLGGARAILVRRHDGSGGSLTFPIRPDRPEAIQAVTVVELLIARAAKDPDRSTRTGRRGRP
ncbi:MAG TPA: hypothetical protein VEY67_12380 [Candidatus Dormibacteraeota bacterium]|nr:hypothetical protein [Candidatus Dormibacteraeota bacterium]